MITALHPVLAEDLSKVEHVLRETMSSRVDLLAFAGREIVSSGGKRLRPIVLLYAYRALGGKDIARVAPLAAAMELLHTASLIHDDINDRGEARRGQPTLNAKWGNALALLAGDFIFVKVMQLVADAGTHAIAVVTDACQALIEGETLQLLSCGNTELSESEYLRSVTLKTAALFAACAELGAEAASGSTVEIAALQAYGRHLGIAFQIRDDVLDLTGTTATLGKSVGHDLLQGQMTLPILYTLQHVPAAREPFQAGDLQGMRRLMEESGGIAHALRLAEEHAHLAVAALDALPMSDTREALAELAEFAVRRQR